MARHRNSKMKCRIHAKIEPVDFKTACYRKFIDEVEKAQAVLSDYRKLLDNLE